MSKFTAVGIEHQEVAKTALQVQNACNLVAVLGAFHTAALKLSRAGLGTDQIRKHPAIGMFTSKVVSLTNNPDNRFSEIYNLTEAMRDGIEVNYDVD